MKNFLKKSTALTLVVLIVVYSCSIGAFAMGTPTIGVIEEYGHHGECYMVTTDNAPLRDSPTKNGTVIEKYSTGNILYTDGLYRNTSTGKYWAKVDGGWMYTGNLELHNHSWIKLSDYPYEVCAGCCAIIPTSETANAEIPINDQAHFALAACSFIPIIGNGCDLADAGLSLYEGDYIGFALNLMAVFPVIGYGFDTIKGGARAAEMVDDIHDIAITVERVDDLHDTVKVVEKLDRGNLRKAMNKAFVESGYTLDRFNSYGEAIIAEGEKAVTAGHHIIGDSKHCSEARNLLYELKIGVNSAENGVYLCSQDKYCVEGVIHAGGHSKAYYQTVNERVLNAYKKAGKSFNSQRSAVIEELDKIAQELMSGKLSL